MSLDLSALTMPDDATIWDCNRQRAGVNQLAQQRSSARRGSCRSDRRHWLNQLIRFPCLSIKLIADQTAGRAIQFLTRYARLFGCDSSRFIADLALGQTFYSNELVKNLRIMSIVIYPLNSCIQQYSDVILGSNCTKITFNTN